MPSVARARHQAFAIGLALLAHEIGMRRAEHHVDGIGAALQDRRHGVDHDLDALVGREQAERQDDRSCRRSRAWPSPASGSTKAKSGMPCGMTSIFSAGTPIYGAQQLPPFSAMTMTFDETSMISIEHAALRRCRLGQHRVKRRDDRHGQPREQRQDVARRPRRRKCRIRAAGETTSNWPAFRKSAART